MADAIVLKLIGSAVKTEDGDCIADVARLQ